MTIPLKSSKNKDSRIILIEADKNGGAGHARNLSLEKATGKYITFLDADDYWEPNFLEEMVSFMKSEKAEFAYCTYARCDENLQPKIADFEADIDVILIIYSKLADFLFLLRCMTAKELAKNFSLKTANEKTTLCGSTYLRKSQKENR
jgi:glycosyltransferase involved in cell wall biosynthesis